MILAIFVLFVLTLSSACISQTSPSQTHQQTGGISQIPGPVESPYISFTEAQQNLREYQPDPENLSDFIKTIYYFTGIDVDGSGNARSWIFGVGRTNGTEMVAYDRSGWTKIPWTAPAGSKEIVVDNIVSPERLFIQNTALILVNPSMTIPERRDLELNQDIYTLTITSGNTSRILTFNATTGELISKQ
jgi:hypothetical protein